MILITGGARSGKSSFAELKARELGGSVLYIATAIPFDEEMEERIRRHQADRPAHWETYEGHRELGDVIAARGNGFAGILLDCVTILTTNLLFDYCGETPLEAVDFHEIEKRILEDIKKLVKGIESTTAEVILVTNEVGWGIVPESLLGRVFRDIAGRVNQYLATHADAVYLAVSGIPIQIKGKQE